MDTCHNLVEMLDEMVLVVDVETFDVLYMNRAAKMFKGAGSGDERKCYKIFEGYDSPCPFCPNAKLSRNKFYVWEFNNTRSRRHFVLKDKLIDWEGRAAKIQIAIDTTEEERVRTSVKEQLEQEQTLIDCIRSVTFTDQIEIGVQNLLMQITGFFQADRTFILECTEDKQHISNTYEWCAPGIPKQKPQLQNLELNHYARWRESFEYHNKLFCDDVETLKLTYPSEYEELTRQGVSRLYAVPMVTSGETFGFIGIDNPKKNLNNYELLESLTFFLMNEIFKRRLLNTLEAANRELEVQNERFKILQGFTKEIVYEYFFDSDIMEYTVAGKKIQRLENFSKNIHKVIYRDDIASVWETSKAIRAGNGNQELEIRVGLEPGEYQWYRAVSGSIYDKEDRPVRLTGKLINIDNLKHRQAMDEITLQQMQLAINRTYTLVMTVYMERDLYSIVHYNEEILNLDRQGTFSGFISQLHDLVSVKDRHFLDMIKDSPDFSGSLINNQISNIEISIESEKHGTHWYEITYTMFENGYSNERLLLLLARNIDYKKDIEESLRRTLRNAEIAGQAKTDFLSQMSHDIRTPLNGIIGMTKIAQRSDGDLMRISDCLNKITTSSEYLLMLINNILDMSKIESGKTELILESMSIDQLLNEMTQIYQPQMENKHVEFIVRKKFLDVDCVIADKLKISQIISNLLSNAYKYVSENGRVRLVAEQNKIDEHRVFLMFMVEDNGIGMSEEFLAKLYDPFEQEKNLETDMRRGSGLGLSICKSLVAMMEGHIQVTSEKGKGSCFKVELPLEIGENNEAENTVYDVLSEADPDTLKGKKVLLVEDNSLNAEIAEFFLSSAGMETDIAANGEEAVKCFENSPEGYYDIILMDIMMPVMNGLEASVTIRHTGRTDAATVPIIAMTANAFKEDVTKSLSHGMDDHITKPLDTERMFPLLSYWIKRGRERNHPL